MSKLVLLVALTFGSVVGQFPSGDEARGSRRRLKEFVRTERVLRPFVAPR